MTNDYDAADQSPSRVVVRYSHHTKILSDQGKHVFLLYNRFMCNIVNPFAHNDTF